MFFTRSVRASLNLTAAVETKQLNKITQMLNEEPKHSAVINIENFV